MKILKKLIGNAYRVPNILSISSEHLKYLYEEDASGYFSKYYLLLQSLIDDGILKQGEITFVEEPVKNDQIYLAHARHYIANIEETLLFGNYAFEDVEMDAHLYEIIKIFCNATLQLSLKAISHNCAMLLGGGFHHAKSDKPGGYCVLNDIAIAARILIEENKAHKILIIDLDVHQGDGTASIFEGFDSVFTFSIHQEDNFPYKKQRSSLDISINSSEFKPKIYLYNLKNSLHCLLKDMKFDIIFYIAGADTLVGDRLGSFSLTLNDLKKRDNIVFKYSKESGTPIAVLMGGGYNIDVNKEIEAYRNTLNSMRSIYR